MATCTCENWTLQDLSDALQNMHKDKKKIAVPMFQRGKRWSKDQQEKFINSLIKGYPVGTMLFYETIESGQTTYILVDGLQRGNSIKKYMNNPTEFFYDSSISDELCHELLEAMSIENSEINRSKIRSILTNFIKTQRSFKNLQYFVPAKNLSDIFDAGFDCIEKLIEIIGVFFKERQDLYEQIAMTVIPVIVYHGAEENLPEIFDRINSQGTPLDQYEVYAAAWPVNIRFRIENDAIIDSVIRKYEAFISDGYIIHGYSRESMCTEKTVNAFEYLFGLSRYLVNKYGFLGFNKGLADDTVNPLGFELVNACLNDSDKIKSLYKNINAISSRINQFESALEESIRFVESSISAIMRFKGNSHSGGMKLFHSKYQILSMISTSFKEMYDQNDFSRKTPGWEEKKNSISGNLQQYYVYDILTNYWSEGGTGKIHSAAKPNRYAQEISLRAWKNALDSFFDKSMFRTEAKQVANPRSEEYVFLNCIYLNTFTAMDQLSLDKFDIEHIAPKEQMRTLISKCNGIGLPISCIANLCYLPDFVNRSKKAKNFYQDDGYLAYVDLDTIENKYSFTTRDDLEWMDMPFEYPDDFKELKQFYFEFCSSRFETMKKKFCASMRINYEEMIHSSEDYLSSDASSALKGTRIEGKTQSTKDYSTECVRRIEQYCGQKLTKCGRSIYKTKDGVKGFVINVSKAYKQGNREKYWFAYRKHSLDAISNCAQKYIVYGCKDANEVLIIPAEFIDSNTNRINYSIENGAISHWHIVLFRDSNGHMTQLFSSPTLEEISIDEFKIGK